MEKQQSFISPLLLPPKKNLTLGQRVYKYLRIRKLSRNGWKVIAVICALNLALTTFTFALPWWKIKCWHNCESHHYTVELDIGVCSVGKSGGFSESNCIKWQDTKTWESIDSKYHTNTAHAAHFIYPRVYKLTVISLCLSLLEFIICVITLYKPMIPIVIYQILMIIIATSFQFVVIFAQGLGSNNSITDGETWKDYTGCSKSYDAPFYAYFTFGATETLTFLIAFIAISPNRCSCFHLVAFDETLDDGDTLTDRNDDYNLTSQEITTEPTTTTSTSASFTSDLQKIRTTSSSEPPPPPPQHLQQSSSFSYSNTSNSNCNYTASSGGGIYDSGIDYRLSLTLKPETLPSYSPPTFEETNFHKI